MNVQGILDELRQRDIHVRADGERLRCDAPDGALTDQLSELLRERKGDILEFLRATELRATQQRAIVPLQPLGERAPVFAVGGHNGDIYCYRLLAAELGPDQPFYGLQPPGLDAHSEPLESIEELAAYFARQILSFKAGAPCIIAGYCAGGAIAFELARQLREQQVPVEFLALFAAPHPDRYRKLVFLRERVAHGCARLTRHALALASGPAAGRRAYLEEGLRKRAARRAAARAATQDPVLMRRAEVERVTVAAASRYHAGFFAGRACLYLPAADSANAVDMPERWRGTAEQVEEYVAPPGCGTDNMLKAPHVTTIAEFFRRCGAAGALDL
jgi:thioesterase domain-containing protein